VSGLRRTGVGLIAGLLAMALLLYLTGAWTGGTWRLAPGQPLTLSALEFSDPHGLLTGDARAVELSGFNEAGAQVLLFPPTDDRGLAGYRYLRLKFDGFPPSHRVQFSWVKAGQERAARAEVGSPVGGSIWVDLHALDGFDPLTPQIALALGPLDFKYDPALKIAPVRFFGAEFYKASALNALRVGAAQVTQFAPEALSAVNLTRVGGQAPRPQWMWLAFTLIVLGTFVVQFVWRKGLLQALAGVALFAWFAFDQARIQDAYAEARLLRAQFIGKPATVREGMAFDGELRRFIDEFKLAFQPPSASTRIFVVAQEVPTYRALYFLAPWNASPLANEQDHLSGLVAGDVVLFYELFSDFIDGDQLWVNRGRLRARQVFADSRGSAFVIE